jgi:hypothetical protein
MLFTNYRISNSLSDEDLYLAASAKRIPAVFPYNGITIGEDLALKQGRVNKTLFTGALNYWFLRDWASWSLGQDCPEVADVLYGDGTEFKVHDPALDKSIPPYYSALVRPEFKSRLSYGMAGQMRPGCEMGKMAHVPYARYSGVWAGEAGVYGPIKNAYSTYKFLSLHAYFVEPVPVVARTVSAVQMPLLNVPIVPFDLPRDRIVYRRSEFEDSDDVPEQDLVGSGYAFWADKTSGFVYYTNSVACYHGLPPVAEALDWPKLELRAIPDGWQKELSGGVMKLRR